MGLPHKLDVVVDGKWEYRLNSSHQADWHDLKNTEYKNDMYSFILNGMSASFTEEEILEKIVAIMKHPNPPIFVPIEKLENPPSCMVEYYSKRKKDTLHGLFSGNGDNG